MLVSANTQLQQPVLHDTFEVTLTHHEAAPGVLIMAAAWFCGDVHSILQSLWQCCAGKVQLHACCALTSYRTSPEAVMFSNEWLQ